jgi:hypothetical protein
MESAAPAYGQATVCFRSVVLVELCTGVQELRRHDAHTTIALGFTYVAHCTVMPSLRIMTMNCRMER